MDYQGNSNAKKDKTTNAEPAPKKDLEKVVSGEVIVTKPGIGAKFKSIFFGGDFQTATQYVTSEVLLPALRNLVVEMVSKGTDRLIYGDSGLRRRPPTSYSPRVQYNNPAIRTDPRFRATLPDQPPMGRWAQGSRSLEDIIVVSKEDADALVDRLIAVVDQYEVVSVADMHELIGLPSSHVDNKWGWTNLATISVSQVREGYRISFPPLEEIS